MATVKRDTTIVTKTVEEKVPVYNLSLSLDEAQALRAALGYVGGDRAHGREHADSILSALRTAGVGSGNFYVKGAAYFADPLDAFTAKPFTSARIY